MMMIAAGEIDDETALIEMLDIAELRTLLDSKGVRFLLRSIRLFVTTLISHSFDKATHSSGADICQVRGKMS